MLIERFPFLAHEYFGNSVFSYCAAILLVIGMQFVLYVIERIIFSKLKKIADDTETTLDNFFLSVFDKTVMPILYVTSFYFGIKLLVFPDNIAKLLNTVFIVVVVIQLTRLFLALILKYIENGWLKNTESASKKTTTKTLMTVLKIVVWGVAIVFLLDNLGFNVSAVVAGLGISGIAVAFALQAILGDLFNYFVIFFDRPFEEGDFIIMGDHMGTVEQIGIKTTRIRSLGGEQIICSNSDLTSSRIRNYKRMRERRVLFKLGVVYQTSPEMMKRIPEILKEIVTSVSETRFDRAHFKGYADFSLDLEIVYYVLSPDYNKYMDIQQEINFKIQEAFAKEGVEFAYPTRTLFMEKTPS